VLLRVCLTQYFHHLLECLPLHPGDSPEVCIAVFRYLLIFHSSILLACFYFRKKSNVSQYIQLTNKLAEFIFKEVAKTGDYAILMLKRFKANLLVVFGFLFTVILANIVSDNPLDNIFTHDITFILDAVLLGSVIYLVVCIFETKYKIRKVHDSYTALKKNYSTVLTPDDIRMAFDEDHLMTEMTNEVNTGMRRHVYMWGIFILGSFLAIEIVSAEPFVWPLIQKLFAIIKTFSDPISNSLSA